MSTSTALAVNSSPASRIVCLACPCAAPGRGCDQAAQAQHQPGREHRAGHVEPPAIVRQEGGQAWPHRRGLVAERGDRGVGLPVGPDVGVELQVGRRVLFRPGAADRREPVEEVTGGRVGVSERLMAQYPQAEIAHNRVPGHPGRGMEGPLRRLRVPLVEVRVAQRGRLRGAQRLLVGGQVQPLAGGEVGDPAVEERAAEGGEVPLAVRGVEPAEIADHRDRKHPVSAASRVSMRRRGRTATSTYRAAGTIMISMSSLNVTASPRSSPQAAAGSQLSLVWRVSAGPFPPPDQDDEGGHDQEDGPDVGQDVLLEDELQRVEQHRNGGHRREPRPDAEADQHRVHQHGRGQPHQVLRQRDDPQVVQQHDRDDQDGVPALPQGVGAPLPRGEVMRVLQVPNAVREDQRRVIGHEHHGPERGREDQQRREQPVPVSPRRGRFGAAQVAGSLARAPVQPVHRSTVTASTGPVGGACRYCQYRFASNLNGAAICR